MSIVVVGSVAFDTVKTPSGTREKALGGSGNFFSVAAQYFSDVQLVGVVGEDFPDAHLTYLKERGIDLAGLEQVAGKTFHWAGHYEGDMNEALTDATDLNVFADFRPKLPDAYKSASTVFLANIDPLLQLDVMTQVESPKIVAMDTMNFWIDSKRDDLEKVMSKVDIVFINDAEAKAFAKADNVVLAAQAIQKLGPQTVVMKRGEYGALLFAGDDITFCPAMPLKKVVDPTGAGDTFAGGFLGWVDRALNQGRELDAHLAREALLAGTTMASLVVQDFSFDATKSLSNDDLHTRLAQVHGLFKVPALDAMKL